MSRDDRFKEMGKHAFPDHRLLPKEIREKFENPSRQVRRRLKKITEKPLRIAYNHMHADCCSGAGYPIDQLLREYLLEYNDRQLGHGLMTLPTSFNVFEGFFEFRVNPPAKFFVIRPEKDHLFSLADFLDFVTSGDRRDDGMRSLFDLRDGIVYNFTPVGDARELAFLHADSSRFVVAGFTMVRRDDQLHWAMIGGPICDLAEKTRELRSNPYELKDKPPEKAFIDVDPSLEFRAEPLAGTDDVWKSIVFGRFNLRTEKHEVRAFGRDHGNHYFMNIDDPETFGIRDPNSLSQREREVLDGMIERIENENVLFEIAVTCFQLPAYFAFRITLVRETKRDTVIAALSAVQRSQISSVDPEKRPLFKTVAALVLVDIGRLPAIRSYTPPQYKVEVNGFWRKLEPESVGKDVLGNVIKGRTWVKGHLRWRDRPERRQSTMFVKSSIASARAKASAIIASDPTAVVIGDELPPIFPTDIEPDNESTGWLYVICCPLMDDDVYKVGWSSRAPKDRAEEISKATGVPMAYIVVESWKVEDARRIEAAVHQALTTFRINPRREFFKAPFEKIRADIIGVLSV